MTTSGLAHRLPFGAELIGDGRTRFRLWAPDCDRLELAIADREPLVMQSEADGWFSLEVDCGAGTAYQFRLPSGLQVPDPASRRQRDDVHGHSLVIDPTSYHWRHPSWRGRPWADIVIYELHIGCYSDRHDFEGVRERLHQLAELGVTAIELMPIADFSGSRNWGYDGVLPFAPATAYGACDALKLLIDTAHELGLCVYLDVVYNHFGPDGNYLHSYAEAFFDADKHSPWGAAIDFSRPEVRQFFAQNALYWLLEYRFDGLRFDAVHAISDPGWLDEMAAAVRAAVEPGRHVHLMLENERNAAAHLEGAFDAQWNDDGHNVLHVLLTGEGEGYYRNYIDAPAHKLARCLAEGFIYQGEPSPGHEGAPRGTPSSHLSPGAFILFLQNHDQVGNRAFGERLTTLVEPRARRAAIILQLLTPQTPLLFMGEELGAEAPFLFFTDFHDELADAVREGRRGEFKAFGAFQSDASRAAIPDPNARSTFDRSTLSWPTDDAYSDNPWWPFYRNLLALRQRTLAACAGPIASLGAEVLADGAVLARWSLGGGMQLHIATNLSNREVPVSAPEAEIISTSDDDIAKALCNGALPPWSTAVWLRQPAGAA